MELCVESGAPWSVCVCVCVTVEARKVSLEGAGRDDNECAHVASAGRKKRANMEGRKLHNAAYMQGYSNIINISYSLF